MDIFVYTRKIVIHGSIPLLVGIVAWHVYSYYTGTTGLLPNTQGSLSRKLIGVEINLAAEKLQNEGYSVGIAKQSGLVTAFKDVKLISGCTETTQVVLGIEGEVVKGVAGFEVHTDCDNK